MAQSEKEKLALELLEIQHEMILLSRVGELCSVKSYKDLTGKTICKSLYGGDQGIVSRVEDPKYPLDQIKALEDRISAKIKELEDTTSDPFLDNLKNSVEKIKSFIGE